MPQHLKVCRECGSADNEFYANRCVCRPCYRVRHRCKNSKFPERNIDLGLHALSIRWIGPFTDTAIAAACGCTRRNVDLMTRKARLHFRQVWEETIGKGCPL